MTYVLLHLARFGPRAVGFNVTRNGDEVSLSWKQLTGILCTIVMTGIAAAGVPAKFLWDQNQRITVSETILLRHDKQLDAAEIRIATLETREAILSRIEQHLNDIDRQLVEIKAQGNK